MTTTTTRNGIDVDSLTGMIQAVTQQPGLARATFSTMTTWQHGFQSEARITDYVQGGQTVERGKTFVVSGDHPEGLLGRNQAPAAVETLIAAVAACIAGG